MSPGPRRIGVAGDWHGNARWATRAIKRISSRLGRGEPAIILHLGDFGIWPDGSGRAYLSRVDAALGDAGAELWFIDGNHEDHYMLSRLSPGPDGRRRVTSRIWHLPRGHRWRWQGRAWLALGGGVSLDKAERTPGRDWWPEEEITAEQASAVTAAGNADVMVTHDCPAGIAHRFPAPPAWWSHADLARNDAHRRRLQAVAKAVRPRWLMHGHLHYAYQRRIDMGWGAVHVTGFDCDGAEHSNWAILDTADMRWECFQGRFLTYLAKGVAHRTRIHVPHR